MADPDVILGNTRLTVASINKAENDQFSHSDKAYQDFLRGKGAAPASTTYVAIGKVNDTTPSTFFGDIESNPPDSKAPPNTPANVPASTAVKIEEISPKANDPANTIDQYFPSITPRLTNLNTQNGTLNGKIAVSEGIPPWEIRSSLRKLPNEMPFFVEMVDVNNKACSLLFPDDSVVLALRLAPNPDNLTINSGKIINKYNTMTRWVEEHWSDEMDTVNFSGSTFSFISYPSGNTGSGLSVVNRRDTQSFQMLKELVRFYRANGCIYQDESTYTSYLPVTSNAGPILPRDVTQVFLDKFPQFQVNHPRQGLMAERLYIRLVFDYVSFIGYFESFDVIEDSTKPYVLTYNAMFKAEKTTFVLG